MFYVYILESLVDGSRYIGCTQNLEVRLHKHNTAQSQATKKKRPWKVIYKEVLPNRSQAMKRETQLKSYKGGEALLRLLKGESSG